MGWSFTNHMHQQEALQHMDGTLKTILATMHEIVAQGRMRGPISGPSTSVPQTDNTVTNEEGGRRRKRRRRDTQDNTQSGNSVMLHSEDFRDLRGKLPRIILWECKSFPKHHHSIFEFEFVKNNIYAIIFGVKILLCVKHLLSLQICNVFL